MNTIEAGKLLAVLSAIDNREVDAVRAQGWSFALDDVSLEVGQLALKDALRATDAAYITPQVIRKYAAPHLRQIARDVKSCKLRGWLPDDWPDEKPLPADVRERLTREFFAGNDLPDEIAAEAAGRPAAIGTVGRGVE